MFSSSTYVTIKNGRSEETETQKVRHPKDSFFFPPPKGMEKKDLGLFSLFLLRKILFYLSRQQQQQNNTFETGPFPVDLIQLNLTFLDFFLSSSPHAEEEE